MGLISVGVGSAQENYGVKYRVLPGRQTGGGEGWTHQHTFMAHDAPVPGTVPVSKLLVNCDQNKSGSEILIHFCFDN